MNGDVASPAAIHVPPDHGHRFLLESIDLSQFAEGWLPLMILVKSVRPNPERTRALKGIAHWVASSTVV